MAHDYRICPHCGRPFDAADPRVQRLTEGAYHAWHALRQSLHNGETVGVSKMARIAGVQPPSMYPFIQQMVAADLVTRIPKKTGGKYFVYRFAPIPV